MALIKKLKDRKKNRQNGKFDRVEVGGEVVPLTNVYLYVDKQTGAHMMEVAGLEEVPQLHYSEVEMDLFFPTKKLHLKAEYRDAFPKGRLRVYKFEVTDVKEFYI